ncbi:hypothetical protein LI291_10730 [Intestinibacillus massiliensis]|nr:hypothetical protein [Intestinibacillus massiliensis]
MTRNYGLPADATRDNKAKAWKEKEKMTREQIKKLFPEATDEQVDAILDANSKDIGKAKQGKVSDDELAALREKAQKYEEAEAEKLSNEEKLKNTLAEAEALKVQNAKMLSRTRAENVFVKAGLSEDEYGAFLDSIVAEDADATALVAENIAKAISAKAEAAKTATREELLKSTQKPSKVETETDDTDQPALPVLI